MLQTQSNDPKSHDDAGEGLFNPELDHCLQVVIAQRFSIGTDLFDDCLQEARLGYWYAIRCSDQSILEPRQLIQCIAYRKGCSLLRQKYRHQHYLSQARERACIDIDDGNTNQVFVEDRIDLMELISGLNAHERYLIQLRFYDSLTYREIADHLDLQNLHVAYRRIKQVLAKLHRQAMDFDMGDD